jgi:hypothetical protein
MTPPQERKNAMARTTSQLKQSLMGSSMSIITKPTKPDSEKSKKKSNSPSPVPAQRTEYMREYRKRRVSDPILKIQARLRIMTKRELKELELMLDQKIGTKRLTAAGYN